MSDKNIRVRTTSSSERPASSRARRTTPNASRVCAWASPTSRTSPSTVEVEPDTRTHGPATTAREYGIPGVVGTREGTERIADGVRVRVDGDNGEVIVLG